ncbi:hypothetical protein KKI24_27490 [bacterium]|nr:hypothetical protein [bacterium]
MAEKWLDQEWITSRMEKPLLAEVFEANRTTRPWDERLLREYAGYRDKMTLRRVRGLL